MIKKTLIYLLLLTSLKTFACVNDWISNGTIYIQNNCRKTINLAVCVAKQGDWNNLRFNTNIAPGDYWNYTPWTTAGQGFYYTYRTSYKFASAPRCP